MQAERAFLVGMLSPADARLGRPVEALVEELRLSDELSGALSRREGEHGRLLDFVKTVERGEADRFEPELSSRDLDLATLQEIEHDAYAWVHGLIQSHAA